MIRERDRYPRRTFREQVDEAVGWVRANKRLVVVAILALAVLAFVFWPPPAVRPEALRVGDCLFIRTSAAAEMGPSTRPIGEPAIVAATLLADGAQRADCGQSHGHEVSALLDYQRAEEGVSMVNACQEAFVAYVGRALDGSRYETFDVRPSVEQWDAGVRHVICLVARRDGQWMDHPARGSGE